MNNKNDPNDFVNQATGKRSNLVAEVIGMLRHNKKWWLLPIIFVILILGLLVILGGSAAAPFIYTLF